MSNREYPYYTGRAKYRGPPKLCDACAEPARFVVSFQTSWFRGDDAEYRTCEAHASMARFDFKTFCDLVTARHAYMMQTVEAQHEETGRRWSGERRALPPRYHEIQPVSEPARHE